MKKFLFFVFFLAPSAWATPDVTAVSGNFGDGSAITITGTGFTNNGPSVALFDDFENKTTGQAMVAGAAKVGSWNSVTSPVAPIYVTSMSVSGALSIGMTRFAQATAGNIYAKFNLGVTTQVFMSYSLGVPSGKLIPMDTTNGINWKVTWMNENDNPQDADWYLHAFASTYKSTTSQPSNGSVFGNDQANYYPPSYFPNITTTPGAPMRRVMFYMVRGTSVTTPSSPTPLQGEVAMFNVYSSGISTNFWGTGKQTVEIDAGAADADYWNVMRVGAYGRGHPDGFGCIDDIYIATGPYAFNRVEIGNSPIYTSSTKTSMVTVTSWTDTSITGTVRSGNFTTDDPKYVFVIVKTGAGTYAVNGSGVEITPTDPFYTTTPRRMHIR